MITSPYCPPPPGPGILYRPYTCRASTYQLILSLPLISKRAAHYITVAWSISTKLNLLSFKMFVCEFIFDGVRPCCTICFRNTYFDRYYFNLTLVAYEKYSNKKPQGKFPRIGLYTHWGTYVYLGCGWWADTPTPLPYDPFIYVYLFISHTSQLSVHVPGMFVVVAR